MLFTMIVVVTLTLTLALALTLTATKNDATTVETVETAETADTVIEKWFAHDKEAKSAYDVFESEDIEYRRIDDYGDWAVFAIKGISLQRRFGRYNMVAKVAYYGNYCHIIYGVVE